MRDAELNRIDDKVLETLADDVFAALRRYRERIKRKHPQLLGGVIYIKHVDGEMAVYSEGFERHNRVLRDAIEQIRTTDGM